MRVDLSKKDVIWSYIGTIMSMASNLLLLPFIVYFLDDDMYGLWGVFASIGAIATLFDCGFSVTFARNITYCWSGASGLKKEGVQFTEQKEPDFVLMKKVLATCKKVYLIVSTAALVLLIVAGTAYVMFISRNLSGVNHIIAWLIYAVSAFLNLYYGYYAAFLRGVGAVDQANKNTVIARSAQIVLTVILLFLGFGLIGTCVAYLAYGMIFRILGKNKFFAHENIGEKLDKICYVPSNEEVNELFIIVWHNAWRDGVISICNYFCNQASTIICSLYLSLGQTGMYSLGVQIASAIAQIAGALYTAYQPTLQEAYVTQNKNKMQKSMSVIITSYLFLFILGTIGALVVGVPFLRIIKPNYSISVSVLLGLCVFQFMMKLRNCYTSYFSCTNRINYLNAFVISSILTVILSFLFTGAMKLGLWGLIIAQIVSQAVYNFWHWPRLAHRELEMSFFQLLRMGTHELKGTLKNYIRRKENI